MRGDEGEVTLVQKIRTRRVAHRTYELYDVWTKKRRRWGAAKEVRFWVITDPTNLYSQDDFPNIDAAFTYHLGLREMLNERYRTEPSEEQAEHVSRPWRRYAKATDAMAHAEEAEDYQALGIQCREALLALAREHMDAPWVTAPSEKPKAADFKGWLGIYAASLTTGRWRAYLGSLADKTWDLAVWLQHYADATEWDAELVLDATAHLLNVFTLTLVRQERGEMSRCPSCDSYRLMEDGDVEERAGRFGYLAHDVCLACGWTSEPEFTEYSDEHLQRLRDLVAERSRLPRKRARGEQEEA
jgi:hypothetical protein